MNVEKIVRQNTAVYEQIASIYAKEWQDKLDTQIAEAFLGSITSGSRILDVGCGPGHYSDFFISKGHAVFSVDISMTMLRYGRDTFNLKNTACMDLQFLAVTDLCFDALWVCASFPHIPKDQSQSVLNDFYNVIKPGGVLFINAIIGDLPYRIESKKEIGIDGLGTGRFFQWYRSSRHVERRLKEAQFLIKKKIEKSVESNVLDKAGYRVNQWVNFICTKN